MFFFRAVTVSFAHLHWMHRLKGQCAHSDHFSTPPRGRDALNGCPGSRWMGIISTQNSNTATIANPHLSAPKMNSEITDLKSDHLILIPPLCIHGLCLHRSTDPKLLLNRTPAFLWAWNILRLRLWKTGKNCNCKLRLIGCSAQMQGYNSTISQPLGSSRSCPAPEGRHSRGVAHGPRKYFPSWESKVTTHTHDGILTAGELKG